MKTEEVAEHREARRGKNNVRVFQSPIRTTIDNGGDTIRATPFTVMHRCHELSLPLNRVCTGQSSDSERARDQWQCAAVTLQVNVSFSFLSCISKHLIECIAIESS